MNKKTKEFVKYVREHLKEYGGTLKIGKGKEVNTGEGLRASGLFGCEPLSITAARKSIDFVGVVAHEYAHFLQWLEYSNRSIDADDNAATIFFGWLGGKDYENKEVQRAFMRITIMERDAERRAVEIIKKFGLDVHIPRYIQRANCYIYMHWVMRERRSWNYKKGAKNPMRSSKLIGMMPDNFKAKSDQTIPDSIRKALLTYYP